MGKQSGEILPTVLFCIFMFLSYFGLLSMLIGSFCSVAFQVSHLEEDASEINCLHERLSEILECYLIDGRNTIRLQEFKLILQNVDVHDTLRKSGTDVGGLMALRNILFPTEDSELTFTQLFSLIVRLRDGKPACASHLMNLFHRIDQRCDMMEDLIRASQVPTPEERTNTAI